MYKPIAGLVAPAATFATIAILPKLDISPVTMVALAIALTMAIWAYIYLLRARGRVLRA